MNKPVSDKPTLYKITIRPRSSDAPAEVAIKGDNAICNSHGHLLIVTGTSSLTGYKTCNAVFLAGTWLSAVRMEDEL